MAILLMLIPISLVLLGAAVGAFVWAVKRGQFDDLDTPALDILEDNDRPAPPPVQAGDDRRGIAKAAADIEHEVAWRNIGGIKNLGQRARVEHDPVGRDLKVFTDIGRFPKPSRHEDFARNGQHGLDDRELGHVRWADLRIDHHRAAGGEVRHD